MTLEHYRAQGRKPDDLHVRRGPSWYRSPHFRELIIRRAKRDRADGYFDGRQALHIDGRCGPDGDCQACREDSLELLLLWACEHLPPPVQGEHPLRYWLRADGPRASYWRTVAELMVATAWRTEPAPAESTSVCHCGHVGTDDGRHRCQLVETATAWHPGHPGKHEGRLPS